jgi:chaperonin cofactor prefoldin
VRGEGILEQMDKRLTNIEGEIVRINNRFEHVNDRFDQVNNRIDQKFNWLMGIMITMWISLIVAVILK